MPLFGAGEGNATGRPTTPCGDYISHLFRFPKRSEEILPRVGGGMSAVLCSACCLLDLTEVSTVSGTSTDKGWTYNENNLLSPPSKTGFVTAVLSPPLFGCNEIKEQTAIYPFYEINAFFFNVRSSRLLIFLRIHISLSTYIVPITEI